MEIGHATVYDHVDSSCRDTFEKNNNRGVDSASGKTNLESPWFGLRNNDATARHPRCTMLDSNDVDAM